MNNPPNNTPYLQPSLFRVLYENGMRKTGYFGRVRAEMLKRVKCAIC